jgi:hypothetical protein
VLRLQHLERQYHLVVSGSVRVHVLRCVRCRYTSEHPSPVVPGDLDRGCPLCGDAGGGDGVPGLRS